VLRPRIFRKTLSLADIKTVEVTRTRLLDGWGIHKTSRGWLYNVSGFDAVLITLHSGKGILLGTDEPERLRSAIARRIASAGEGPERRARPRGRGRNGSASACRANEERSQPGDAKSATTFRDEPEGRGDSRLGRAHSSFRFRSLMSLPYMSNRLACSS